MPIWVFAGILRCSWETSFKPPINRGYPIWTHARMAWFPPSPSIPVLAIAQEELDALRALRFES